MTDFEVLQKLTSVIGPAGYEDDIQATFLDLMTPFTDSQYTDALGNTYCEISGGPNKQRLMFTAHADTIGFMVRYIDDMGFVFTGDLGGCEVADPKMLPGTDISILSRTLGVVIEGHHCPVLPYHLATEEDTDLMVDRAEMAIDIGSKSEDETAKLLSIGDFAVIKPECRMLRKRIVGTSLDDRVAMFILYRLAKQFHSRKRSAKSTLVFCATTSEETASGNSGLAASVATPDIAITLDVLPATDVIVHDADFEVAKRYGRLYLDDGPILSRGGGITDSVFIDLETLAVKAKIPTQVDLAALDTDGHHIQRHGVRTGFIGIPVRNAHTRIETVAPGDIEMTVKLCTKYVSYVDQS